MRWVSRLRGVLSWGSVVSGDSGSVDVGVDMSEGMNAGAAHLLSGQESCGHAGKNIASIQTEKLWVDRQKVCEQASQEG